jgi:hypothetical protein
MARALNSDQQALLQSGNLKVNWLATFLLDEGDGGTFYFCDDWCDLTDSVTNPDSPTVYIGASALCAVADIVSSKPYAAESVDITLDGTRLAQTGFTDPAALFRDILGLNLHQRRVNFALGVSSPGTNNIQLIIPIYAGKINNARMTVDQVDISSIAGSGAATQQPVKLMITLDSLAMRYQWSAGRTRSHHDQLEIDPNDLFFSFVNDTIANERNLYWGVNPPAGKVTNTGVNIQGNSGNGGLSGGGFNGISPFNNF